MKLHKILLICAFLGIIFVPVFGVRILDPQLIPYIKRRMLIEELEAKRVFNRLHHDDSHGVSSSQFHCHDQVGSFGDPNQECRVFHVCQIDGRRDSFFCPAATRFNDRLQLCDWKSKVNEWCNARQEAPVPQEPYLLPREEERTYRNQYQDQEYYRSVHTQMEPKVKYVIQSANEFYNPKRTFMYVTRPVFTHFQPQLVIDSGVFAEDGSSVVQEQTAAVVTDQQEQLSPQVPQSAPISAENPAFATENIRTSEIQTVNPESSKIGTDTQQPVESNAEITKELTSGFEVNPVIELWIPSELLKAAKR